MIFPYISLPGYPKTTRRPYVTAQLKYKEKETPNLFFLVDSGSDCTYADHDIAVWLGIDLSKTRQITSFGVNRKPFVSFPFKTSVSIGGYDINLPILFTKSFGREAILGQEVFFDSFRVIFERYKWRLELIPKISLLN